MGIHALSGLILTIPMLKHETTQAQIFNDNEKTLSPYFVIPDGDPVIDKIPLLSTSADVNIVGVIADVTITQIYKNEGEKAIEAIYVFPASTRAAVYHMQMTIGERKIEAKIAERQKAREAYEDARENGQSASLLEQERPNVFTMNVANIMPGDEILVELSYTELLIPEGGVYEFVYPSVVGPRYSNVNEDLASNADNWIKNPYTHEGTDPLYTFDIKASISAGMPIQDVSCKTHRMEITYDDPSRANLKQNEGQLATGNKDVIIRYRLAGEKIESGLLLFEGEEENFFLAMVQPPARPVSEQIPPREYVFIVDVSGSMWGYPLDISKDMMKKLLGNLKPTDRFNILLFSYGSGLFSEQSLEANVSNIRKGIDFIDRQQGGGGTELLPALKRALALKGTEDYARSFVILTDGYVSVEKEAFDLIRENIDNANFFSFGIGSSVNRFLIEGIAHAGMGTPFIVTSEEYAAATAEKFRKYIQTPVLTNIKTDYDGFEVYDIQPLSLADVFAERPLIIFGKWKGEAKGSIRIEGLSGEGRYIKTLEVEDFKAKPENAALTYLWAREKIRVLDDYASLSTMTASVENEVTALGLKYNLLTRYTSFVAIDNKVRNEDGTYTTVSQPLPLPEGVSNYAVGGIRSHGMQKSIQAGIYSSLESSGVLEESRKICCLTLEESVRKDDTKDDKKEAEFTADPDGVDAFILKTLVHPTDALKNNVEGWVYLEFTIEVDGSVSDVKVLFSSDEIFENEALRLLNLTDGKWKAAEESGNKVRSKMILEIPFELSK